MSQIVFTEIATPSAPASGKVSLYVDESANLHIIDSSGNDRNLNFIPSLYCDGRLTLQSGSPVPTSDVSDATTLYFTNYYGNRIALYDGTNWNVRAFGEKSLSGLTSASSIMYDIWAYDTGSDIALASTAWSNLTTRATELTTQDGVVVKSGDATHRYLGTVYCDTTSKLQDTLLKRFVWNLYHKETRYLYKTVASTHTYASTSVRAWNNDTSNIFEAIFGMDDLIDARISSYHNPSATGYARFGMGLDGLTSITESYGAGNFITRFTNSIYSSVSKGYHYFLATEAGNAGTSTFYNYEMTLGIRG